MPALLRGAQSAPRGVRRGRYNPGIDPSSALRDTNWITARDERHHSGPSWSRSSRRRILPVVVFGSSSMNSIDLGYL